MVKKLQMTDNLNHQTIMSPFRETGPYNIIFVIVINKPFQILDIVTVYHLRSSTGPEALIVLISLDVDNHHVPVDFDEFLHLIFRILILIHLSLCKCLLDPETINNVYVCISLINKFMVWFFFFSKSVYNCSIWFWIMLQCQLWVYSIIYFQLIT